MKDWRTNKNRQVVACYSDAFCSHVLSRKKPQEQFFLENDLFRPARNIGPVAMSKHSWTCLKPDTINTVGVHVQSCPGLTQWGKNCSPFIKREIKLLIKKKKLNFCNWTEQDAEQEIGEKRFLKSLYECKIMEEHEEFKKK